MPTQAATLLACQVAVYHQWQIYFTVGVTTINVNAMKDITTDVGTGGKLSHTVSKILVVSLSIPCCLSLQREPNPGTSAGRLCCGSGSKYGSRSTGSTCFWASWIQVVRGMAPDPDLVLEPDPEPSKYSKKHLDSYYFLTSFWLFIIENDVNVPSKSEKQKNFFFNKFFVGILKVNDENRRTRIRIGIRIH